MHRSTPARSISRRWTDLGRSLRTRTCGTCPGYRSALASWRQLPRRGTSVEVGRGALLLAGAHRFFEVLRRQPHIELRDAFVIHVGMEARRVEARPEHALRDLDADATEADDAFRQRVARLEQL